MTIVRLALAAATLLALGLPAEAGTGTLSIRSTVHEGPGREYKILGYVEPGRIPLGQCRKNLQEEDWCYVDREVDPGWIHVIVKKAPRKGGGAGTADNSAGGGGSSQTTTTTADGGDTPGPGGDEGMSSKDAASLPSDNGGSTKGDRLATYANWTKKATDPSKM